MVFGERVRAATYDLALNDEAQRALRMYVSDSLPTVRGVFIFCNGGGSDARWAASTPELTQMATSWGFALIATSQWRGFYDSNELQSFLTQVNALAQMSHRPELVNVPWVPTGDSNGGIMSYQLNLTYPEKTLFVEISKYGGAQTTLNTRPPTNVIQTPGLFIAGEKDLPENVASVKDLFTGNRPRGAL